MGARWPDWLGREPAEWDPTTLAGGSRAGILEVQAPYARA